MLQGAPDAAAAPFWACRPAGAAPEPGGPGWDMVTATVRVAPGEPTDNRSRRTEGPRPGTEAGQGRPAPQARRMTPRSPQPAGGHGLGWELRSGDRPRGRGRRMGRKAAAKPERGRPRPEVPVSRRPRRRSRDTWHFRFGPAAAAVAAAWLRTACALLPRGHMTVRASGPRGPGRHSPATSLAPTAGRKWRVSPRGNPAGASVTSRRRGVEGKAPWRCAASGFP